MEDEEKGEGEEAMLVEVMGTPWYPPPAVPVAEFPKTLIFATAIMSVAVGVWESFYRTLPKSEKSCQRSASSHYFPLLPLPSC
jgi:hypothetical protein